MRIKKISKNELIKQVRDLGNRLNRKPKKRDNNYLYFNSRKIFGSWNNLMKSAGYKVRYYQYIRHVKLNEDFAYFLGLVITDGHIVHNKITKKYQTAIYTSYPEEKDMILELIKGLFNYKAGITPRMCGFSKKPNYEIRIASKNLTSILINDFNIPAGAKSLIVDLPKKIISSSTKIKMAFLRGVIDGDGSITSSQIKISSGSEKFLISLKELLKSLTISSGELYKRKDTKTVEFKIPVRANIEKLKEIYNINKWVYLRKKEQIGNI